MKVSSVFSRILTAFKATCDEVRTSHLWWPLFSLVVISIPLIGWVSYQTDQTLAEREQAFQFRLTKEDRTLLDEGGRQYDELLPTLHDYCAKHEEALEDPLTDPVAVQRVRQVYEEAPEIQRQVRAAKDELAHVRFSGQSAAWLVAVRDTQIAMLESYEQFLIEDQAQLQVLEAEGVSGLLKYRDDGRLEAAESLNEQKLKEAEDLAGHAERSSRTADEALAIQLERFEIERQRRRTWVLLAQASLLYLTGIALAISIKFVRNFRRSDESAIKSPRRRARTGKSPGTRKQGQRG